MKPTTPSFSTALVNQALGQAPGQAPGNTTRGRPEVVFSAITTDSRKISRDCLFVAIAGEKFDGHAFIENAIAGGAAGVICKSDYAEKLSGRYPSQVFFGVEDTQQAFRALARAWRQQFRIPVVAVAGSNGKTTTKELLAAILTGKYARVLKTQASQNGFLGIPMTLLDLRPEHEAAVVEVGIDDIGAMEQHLEIVRPGIAVLTVIGPEHLEHLQDVPTVAREETLALKHVARAGGSVAINLDDPWIQPLATSLDTPKKLAFTLGDSKGPSSARLPGNLPVLRGRLTEDRAQLMLEGLDLTGLQIKLPLPGKHNASNALAAIATAHLLGLTPAQIRKGLESFKGAEGRSELRYLSNGLPVLCDYYNASPVSMKAGLELLTEIARDSGKSRRRWACLADMLELGSGEEKFHRELADQIVALGIENVLLYGNRMKWLQEELRNRSYSGNLSHFPTQKELATALVSGVKDSDVVLIKGSRSMKMEEVWKAIHEGAAPHPHS